MVTWKDRASWGAEAARPGTARADELVGITDHDAPFTRADLTTEQYGAVVREIQGYYMSGASGQGSYVDIPYNALYDPLGNIWEGRANGIVGAHATSNNNAANRVTLGLCYLGNGDLPLSEAAQEARKAYYYVVSFGVIHRAPFHLTHRDWEVDGGIPTHCAGDWLQAHNVQ